MVCQRDARHRVKKKGYYQRLTGRTPFIQRYFCRDCQRTFSPASISYFRGERKRHVNQRLMRLVDNGMSQRAIAIELAIHRTTVARKIIKLARYARLRALRRSARLFRDTTKITFDEMETFEHTKCKPLSIALVVDAKTRLIIAARVAKMPAKGPLAAISLKKYGKRADRRSQALQRVLSTAKRFAPNVSLVRSDECPRYPGLVKKSFPMTKHETFKGRRAALIGQGELKRGGFDPLFALNHSAAMYRDHLKRLSRKTWCTTKSPARLQDQVDLYAWHHNQTILRGKKRVRL